MSRFFYIAPLLSLFLGVTANAEVILKYDFDRGYNVDNVSGTIATEGSADDIKNNPGLLPSGLKNPALIPGKQVDPLRAFTVVDSGKALLTGVDKKTGNRIDYSVKLPKALSEQQGAISFYITPVDWSGTELGKFHNFVALYSADRKTNIMVYKYHDRRMIFVNIANGKKNQSLRIDVSKWTPGEKHFVAFLWNKNNSSLYVDGQVVSRQLDLPEKPLTDMRVGSFGWGTEQGLSLIDDLTCYGSKVNHDEIVNVYSKGFSLKGNRQAPVRVQLNKKTAKIDGQVTPGEYSFESNLGFDLVTSLVTFQVKWYLARDDKNLYFAVKRPALLLFNLAKPTGMKKYGGTIQQN